MSDFVVVMGSLSSIRWSQIEAFARALAEFCKVHVSPDHVVTCPMEAGEIEIRWSGPAVTDGLGEARLRLTARQEPALQNLRDTLGHMLDLQEDGLAAQIRWEVEGDLEGRLPLNFRLARVVAAERLNARFLRLSLEAEDLGFLNQTGLHLRLLQPRDAAAPHWPRLSASGRTVWPKSDVLHGPVYTIRQIDVAAGRLELDVFLHGNGPTCAWAALMEAGLKTGAALPEVGLLGPGGGWLPEGGKLCLGGDETALPVIARILEAAAPQTEGQALIEVGDASEIQPIAAPQGIKLQWLLRRRGEESLAQCFAAISQKALSDDLGTVVQFAGEKADAVWLRSTLREGFGKLPPAVTSAAYWTRSAAL